MRLYHSSELIVHTARLGTSGIVYRQYWILNCLGTWYPERILELVLVGDGVYPMKNVLLPIKIPRVRHLGKRELGVLVAEETGKASAYLARVGNLMSRQLSAYLRDEPLPYGPKKIETDWVWMKIRRRYSGLAGLMGPNADSDGGEDEEKPP